MKCFWCGAPGVQHAEPTDVACLGIENEDAAFDTVLERAAQEIAEEQWIAAEEDRE